AGGPSISRTGWLSRMARAGPHSAETWFQKSSTAVTGPTMEEQRRTCLRAWSANPRIAAGPALTGTRLAPEEHRAVRRPCSTCPHSAARWKRVPIPVDISREATQTLPTGSVSRIAQTASRSRSLRIRTDEVRSIASSPLASRRRGDGGDGGFAAFRAVHSLFHAVSGLTGAFRAEPQKMWGPGLGEIPEQVHMHT